MRVRVRAPLLPRLPKEQRSRGRRQRCAAQSAVEGGHGARAPKRLGGWDVAAVGPPRGSNRGPC